MAEELPENAIQPATRAAWRRWLERHHTRDRGVWFVYFKKSSGKQRFTYDDMVEEALCFGWIDGQARALDDERSMLWLSPRKPKSVWSAPNKVRVARVIAAGLMHPTGQAKVDAAKANGSWAALDATDRLDVPDDLAAALAATPKARAHFDAFPATAKKAVLEWVRQAKRPETRARRIAEAARMAGANERMTGTSPKAARRD
ncbi:MAG: YdeI/OmpD-associated family protein [Acidobacteria bacterium]|nr:YdeI/OmpD-associated family protein [Acidobacteriota bacterium]